MKRRTWRKVHLALNTNTDQVHATLMTSQNEADGDALAKLLDQIPRKNKSMSSAVTMPTTPSHAMRPLLHAVLFLRLRHARVAAHWPADMRGSAWRNGAVDAIARDGRREWKQDSGYHRRSLSENAMYRLKTLTGKCLWARHIDKPATEVAVRVGVINRMADLARPQSIRIA